MDVVAADVEVGGVADAVVGEASLPNGEFGGEAVGEASLDDSNADSDGAFEGFVRGQEEVDMVGHDDEGVEFVAAFGAVVVEGCDEEFGVASTWKRRRRL